MGEKHNVKFEIIDHRKELQKLTPHQELALTNRWRVFAVVFAMTAVIVLGFALLPDGDRPVVRPVQQYATEMNPVLSSEVNELKGQFVGLVSGSIESKLRMLEDNIRTGAISNSLTTIQDLKNDVKVLRAYSEPNQKKPAVAVSNAQLVQEISHLRNLIYLTLTSCGLMVAAVAGIWFKNRRRLPFQDKTVVTHYLGKR